MTNTKHTGASGIAPIGSAAGHLHRFLVVGLGQSGTRFLRACMTLKGAGANIDIVGAIDLQEDRRRAFEALGLPAFSAITDARALGPIDAAIIASPETQHFNAISEIIDIFPTVRRIICEKPLTRSISEAERLGQSIEDDRVTLNFVERFSPIVERLIGYMADNGRHVVRINGNWGKYRIKDIRPTTGVVLSELAHLVDLSLFLAAGNSELTFEIKNLFATSSNFDIADTERTLVDTVHFSANINGSVQMIASSSLLWPERRREVQVFLADASGIATEMASLRFDAPIWDRDHLQIIDVRSVAGRPSLVLDYHVPEKYWPEDWMTIGKVCEFVRHNLAELEGTTSALLPKLRYGLALQRILHAIEDRAQTVSIVHSDFSQPATAFAMGIESRIEFLSRQWDGKTFTREDLTWDHLY